MSQNANNLRSFKRQVYEVLFKSLTFFIYFLRFMSFESLTPFIVHVHVHCIFNGFILDHSVRISNVLYTSRIQLNFSLQYLLVYIKLASIS